MNERDYIEKPLSLEEMTAMFAAQDQLPKIGHPINLPRPARHGWPQEPK